jgi:hypothetical protein
MAVIELRELTRIKAAHSEQAAFFRAFRHFCGYPWH